MYSVGDRFVLCLSEYSPISWAKDQRHMEEIFFFFLRVVFKSSKGVASPWYHRGPTWRGCLYIAMYSHPRIWPQNLLLTTDSTQPLELAHQTMEENSFMKEWKIFIDNFTKSISFFYIWPMFGGHPWCFQGYNFSSEVFSCFQGYNFRWCGSFWAAASIFSHQRVIYLQVDKTCEQRTLSRDFWLACLRQPHSGFEVVVRNVLDARDGCPNHGKIDLDCSKIQLHKI